MAIIKNKLLFFTTSPRSPVKMIPEIDLLCKKFGGLRWNTLTQELFIEALADSDYFDGVGYPSDKAFSARDRINRAPKALGFVNLKPNVSLTEVGSEFLYGKRPHEVFLRQLLKFQLPSPYHKESRSIAGSFCIRPFLEILRLIRELERLSFDELKIFALQLIDYHNYEDIKNQILDFRKEREKHQGRYAEFVDGIWTEAVLKVHKQRIANGNIRTRETRNTSLKSFIKTQKHNMRDYADACFRYLRFTGMVAIEHRNRTISVFEDKLRDVDFILESVNRNPVFIDDEAKFKEHLFSPKAPVLYVDNKDNIIDVIMHISDHTKRELEELNINELKDLRDNIVDNNKKNVIQEQVKQIKSYALYSEIVDTFNEIVSDEYYDAPLMLEYNTWRAMTMLDGGEIKGNFKFDDKGKPLSTAAGNMPDIECDYGDFVVSVEVTMQSGQRQYESEGEPVARHYGRLKKKSGKDTYCIFIAPSINEAALAHFYALNHMSISLYGGKSKIIPLELDQFMKLIDNSYNYHDQPNPTHLRELLNRFIRQCEVASDENQWRDSIQNEVDAWLTSI